MMEKFTERAHKVMRIARQEAQRLCSEFVCTEHILLGIIQDGGGVAAKVLKNLNVDLKRIFQEIEKLIIPSPSPVVTLGQLTFSPRAKRVIDLAYEEASRFGHDVIGTEDLLLGLLKESDGTAAKILRNMGLKLDQIRDMTMEVLGVELTAGGVCTRCKGTGREPLSVEVQETSQWLIALTAKVVMGTSQDERRRILEDLAKAVHTRTTEAYEKGRQTREGVNKRNIVSDSLIEEAAAFAKGAHAGQLRKYTALPYIEHPERVAQAVWCIDGSTPEMVAAAWLHDVVEDTSVSLKQIRNLFGDGVADLVGWLTNPSKGMTIPRAERKKIDREHLAKAPREAKIIKMLDRLDNLSEMEGAPADFKKLYGAESLLLAEAIGDAESEIKNRLVSAASIVGRG